MTNPFDLYQGYVNDSNAAKDAFMQQILVVRAFSVNPTQQGMAQAQSLQSPTYAQAHQTPPADPSWKDEDLVAGAVWWGMPEEQARAMPREAVIAFVNDMRQKGRQINPEEVGAAEMLMLPFEEIALGAAGFAAGAGQAVTGGLQRLGFGVGEALSRVKVIRDADMTFRKLEEAVRASSPGEMELINTGIEGTGHLAAMWYPGNAAWAASGKAGRMLTGLRESKYALAAFQGGASSYLLEGGSDFYKEHPVMMLAGGALLGSAFEAAAPWAAENVSKLVNRVQASYVPRELIHVVPRQPTPTAAGTMPDFEIALLDAANRGDESALAVLANLRESRGGFLVETSMGRGARDMEIPLNPNAVRVYTGSRYGGTDLMPQGYNESNHLGPALYTSTDPLIAEGYALVARQGPNHPRGQAMIHELRLNPQRVFDYDAPLDPALAVTAAQRFPQIAKKRFGTNAELYQALSEATGSQRDMWSDVIPGTKEANDFLHSQGFDAIKKKSTDKFEQAGFLPRTHDEYAILNPKVYQHQGVKPVTALRTDPMSMEFRRGVEAADAADFAAGSEEGEGIVRFVTEFARKHGLDENSLWDEVPAVLDPPPGAGRVLNNADAEALSVAMNKAATVIQSPDFINIAGQTQLDDLAVARAAIATNPGGDNIVQGVADPAQFMAGLVPEGKSVAFVQRGNRLDGIVTDYPVGPSALKEYEKFGVMSGQSAYTPDGRLGRVTRIKGNNAVIELGDGTHLTIPANTVQPLGSSVANPAIVPDLYGAFQGYTNMKVTQVAEAMGGAMTPAQTQLLRMQNITKYAEDFLTEIGIETPGNRDRILQYFSQRYADDFKMFAPAETAKQQIATANYNSTVERVPLPPVQALDQLAATKGFVAIPEQGGWTLRSLNGGANGARLQFADEAAATEWLRNTNVELPDITPPSDVPLQIAGQFPTLPTQGSNTNATAAQKLVDAIAEIDDIPSSGGGNFGGPPAQVAAASGNIGRLKNLWTDGFMRWRPARRFFSAIDESLHEAGRPLGISADYDGMSTLVTRNHNEMHPFMDRLTDATGGIKAEKLVSGQWGRFWMAGPNREALARSAGYTPKEIAAFSEFDRIITDLGGDADTMRKYFAHIAQRQSDPDPAVVAAAFDGFTHTPATQGFAEYAKAANLNFREFDPRFVGEMFIRAHHWQKNMQGPWQAIQEKWSALGATEELAPAANVMKNWLSIIKEGYHAEDDLALDAIHGALRVMLGPEVNRGQARELANLGMNATHAGLLGFRPFVMARDALQLLFAVPRAGDDLLRVMHQWSSGGEEVRGRMWQEALDAGAIALSSPRMASPGSFAGELEAAGAGLVARDEWTLRHKVAGRITNAVRDLIPSSLRNTKDSMLHPMYFYGKQSERMRALVYTAGKQKADRAIAAYRQTGDMAALMKESGARTYDPSWQRQFQNIVATGNDAEASRFLGRQLADATQFKYGPTESPWAAKSITGKMALQMGNYSLQYMQYMRESMTAMYRVGRETGDWSDAVKFLTTAGAVTAGLEAASRETGWNFRWMNPYFGLGFTGGPMVGAVADIGRGVSATFREAQGQRFLPTAGAAGMRAAGDVLQNMNPLGGIAHMAGGVAAIANSPYPGRTLGKYLITGEADNQNEVSQQLMPQTQENFQESLQPLPSPISATQRGIPGGIIPQQIQSYPQIVSGPMGPPWSSGYPSNVPGDEFSNAAKNEPTPDEVRFAAIGYDPKGRFTPADMQFLTQFYDAPPEVAWEGWLMYRQEQKNQRAAGNNGMVGRTPVTTNPGSGALY